MHVALNLVYLVPGEVGGMETYARELVPRLAARDDLRVTCLVGRAAVDGGGGAWGDVCPMEVVPVDARSRVQWVRGEQQHVPRIAARIGADVVHSLASTTPLWGRVPRVTTVHDLLYLVVPEAHFGLRSLGMRVLVPAGVRRSRRVIADSEATKRDLVERLGADPGSVDVVPLGGGAPAGRERLAEAEIRARHDLGDRRIALSTSAKRPHKNIAGLLDALARIAPERRPLLVVPGYPTPYEEELRAQAERLGIAADVRWLSWVSPEELEGLYATADVVVFPSFYEGFGLPVLEGMSRGVPVVTSNRSSLPEVAGDAALLVDPDRPEEIAAAIERVLFEDSLAARLRDDGLARAAEFSWDR